MTWGTRKTKLVFSVPQPNHINFCGYCYVLTFPGESEKSHLLSGRLNQRNLHQIDASAMWLTCPRGTFPPIWKSHRLVIWSVRNTLCSKKLFHAHWDGEEFVDLQIWTSWRLTSCSSEKRPRHFRSSLFQFLLTFSGKVLLLAVVASADCKLARRITILFSETNSTLLRWRLLDVLEVLGYKLRFFSSARGRPRLFLYRVSHELR
jgi:hypothetical protein